MGIKFNKYTILFLGVIVVAASLGPAWAGEKTEVLTINQVPEYAPDGASVPGVVEGGRIDDIQNKGIIVGDSFYPFARSCSFLSYTQNPISPSKFETGMTVGFRLNKKGEIIVMWIDKTKRGDED